MLPKSSVNGSIEKDLGNIQCSYLSVVDLMYLLHFRHITPEKFYVEACDDGADDVLAIDRVSTEVTLTGICFKNFLIRHCKLLNLQNEVSKVESSLA